MAPAAKRVNSPGAVGGGVSGGGGVRVTAVVAGRAGFFFGVAAIALDRRTSAARSVWGCYEA